jgi:transglutaminase-like putative cysteine protease
VSAFGTLALTRTTVIDPGDGRGPIGGSRRDQQARGIRFRVSDPSVAPLAPSDPGGRVLRVRHITDYRYDRPVERSVHQGHLRPFHDSRQSLLDHGLRVTADPDCTIELVDYEDAFGNAASRFEVGSPYRSLRVEAESLVALPDVDPYAFRLVPTRPTIPLNWMPRERLALTSYLQSQELPDPQIDALFDYAMTFVKDNDGDLLEALFALNLELFTQYEYVPGSTSNATSAYDVYTTRRGVCQDFAGLFITLMRLIRVPARYVCGYLHTGNAERDQQAGRAPSDATHAWVEVYLPFVGWRGFDPTNGVLPRLDHVRLAVGRHWRDTAPVTGTLFGDPVRETLEVRVEVTEASSDPSPPA